MPSEKQRMKRGDFLKSLLGMGVLASGYLAAMASAKGKPPWAGHQTATSTTATTTTTTPSTTIAAPPTTAAASGAIDDKRAIYMAAISSTGAVVNPDGTPNGQPDSSIVRTQSPDAFWTSLIYTNDDVSLIQDARFGQVYRFRTNGDSRNPYWSTATTCNTELVLDRLLSVGQTDWYAFRIKWEPGWDYANVVDWHSVFQFGYPTISSPPVGLFAGYGDNIFIQRYCGLVVDSKAAEFQLWNVDKQSRVQGHWLDCLLGIKWGSHNDGEIHFASRCQDLGEASLIDRLNVTGINTWQWGGALNVPQDPSNFRVNDKLDSYYGYKPGLTDADVPTNYLQHTGHARCASKAEALSYL